VQGYNLQESVLLIGIHTRPAVFSAKALGLYTLSVDYFGDVDLLEAADVARSIRQQKPFESSGRISDNYSGEALGELASDLEADRIISTCSLNIKRPVTGNPPDRMIKLKDKGLQLRKVRKLGIKVPEYEIVEDREEAIEVAEGLGFPCVVKPLRGAGGRGVLLAKTKDHLPDIQEKYLVQGYVRGNPISTSTLSTKKDSMLLSTSEQLLGCALAGQKDFVHCGNVVPLEATKKEVEELEDISIKISRAFGIVGWNGIDFVLGQEPVFIEINSRFQGTFDCIERSYNINLLDAHIKACEGELIKAPHPSTTSIRMTIYAQETCIVKEDLRGSTVDVPLKNSIIEKGEPITTIISSGKKEEALDTCKKLVKKVYKQALSRWPR
jgi:predicted ATP-grasp superfamily ATP-dependent carboligase